MNENCNHKNFFSLSHLFKIQKLFVEKILDEAPFDKYPRVNNNNKGYNHRFSNRTGSIPHPNIWKLVEIFQKEEFLLVQVRCERLKDGSLTSVGERKCDLKRNIQILQAKKKYLRSRKTYEDLLLLFESGICAVQNFELD